MLHRNAKWTQWGQVSFTPGVEFMQPLNRLTQTLWRSLYVTSALRHCDEVCCITIQSEHIEAKFIFVVGGKFYSTGSLLTGARISLCDEKLTPFLFLKGFFFVSSLHLRPMTWLFLHYFSVLSTSWLFLFFLLLSVLFKFFLADAALFGTYIVNCLSLCCVSVGIFSLSFTTCPSLLPTLLLW